jgi:hypothetical protein
VNGGPIQLGIAGVQDCPNALHQGSSCSFYDEH